MSRFHAVFCCALLAPVLGLAAEPIALPKPRTQGGKPLMQALAERKSSREFSPEKLPPQTLSDLLWAAYGISRPDGRRTAPTASNRQEIEIYVALAEGVYRYDAKSHRLDPVVSGDLRGATGTQDFVAGAPLNLVYVADFGRVSGGNPEDKSLYAAADTGFISQNVYLYCASEGLATVVRGSVDRAALAKALKLPENQRVMLAQTVGYAAK